MPEFSPGVRKFWLEVAKHNFGEVDGQAPDLRLVYTEEQGFHFSGLPADEVHHIIPGSMATAQGLNPNAQTGLPVSRNGHRGKAALPYEPIYSFHPDMEKAAKRYKAGDKDAFGKALARHKARALEGKVIPGFVPEVAIEHDEMMTAAAVKFIAETGVRKPISQKQVDRPKKWYDDLF